MDDNDDDGDDDDDDDDDHNEDDDRQYRLKFLSIKKETIDVNMFETYFVLRLKYSM